MAGQQHDLHLKPTATYAAVVAMTQEVPLHAAGLDLCMYGDGVRIFWWVASAARLVDWMLQVQLQHPPSALQWLDGLKPGADAVMRMCDMP